jgi:hypothetical protein
MAYGAPRLKYRDTRRGNEGYCKTPHPLTARQVCTPHLWCGGRSHSLGGEGVGGQYFGRRQTLLCTLHKYLVGIPLPIPGCPSSSKLSAHPGVTLHCKLRRSNTHYILVDSLLLWLAYSRYGYVYTILYDEEINDN